MSRTTALKIGYCLALGALVAVAAFAFWALGGTTGVLVVVGLLLLVPGRIQGFFFRDLFRGRRLLDAGQPQQSLVYSQRFLDQIRQRPWQKRLLWLSWSIYTTDVAAMALNNIGAAHLELGAWDAAKAALREAIDVDPQYAIPYFNLALIAELEADRQSAEERLAEAAARGYTSSKIDRVVAAGQELLARLEGRGVRTPGA
jgi:tetratricopeptide (TPR) repeat protein